MKLVEEMKEYTPWMAKPAKRVYIPKANGKLRPLGQPVIKDRVAQAIVKNALEPEWEAQFEANSYGFRPGRSCQDAIEQCWIRLNGHNKDEWMLNADIAGCFDKIDHQILLSILRESRHDVKFLALISELLKAGYMEEWSYHPTR